MSELDVVRQLARRALLVSSAGGSCDNCLWDRSGRLVDNVERIRGFPEVVKSGVGVDRFCLIAAAHFSDAGTAHGLKSKGAAKQGVFNGNNGLLELSAKIVTEKLEGYIDDRKVEKIGRIITESGDRFTRWPEAMILSDARNLDDMGAVGIFYEFRGHCIGGKGAYEAVKSWKKKIDYRYWQARLQKNFRFESVRRIAERRLVTAERFMNQLKVETEGLDLEELSMTKAVV